jgi:hypothetical protein
MRPSGRGRAPIVWIRPAASASSGVAARKRDRVCDEGVASALRVRVSEACTRAREACGARLKRAFSACLASGRSTASCISTFDASLSSPGGGRNSSCPPERPFRGAPAAVGRAFTRSDPSGGLKGRGAERTCLPSSFIEDRAVAKLVASSGRSGSEARKAESPQEIPDRLASALYGRGADLASIAYPRGGHSH